MGGLRLFWTKIARVAMHKHNGLFYMIIVVKLGLLGIGAIKFIGLTLSSEGCYDYNGLGLLLLGLVGYLWLLGLLGFRFIRVLMVIRARALMVTRVVSIKVRVIRVIKFTRVVRVAGIDLSYFLQTHRSRTREKIYTDR